MLTREDLEEATRIVRAHVPVTPAYRWPLLEDVTGVPTWVKHENVNPQDVQGPRRTGVRRSPAANRPTVPGLVAVTRGNHGQSVAYAGREHGVPVTVVVPGGNSPDKNASMAAFGAGLVVHGRDFQEALEHAMALADQQGLVPVPSFHLVLVAGVATGAAELHTQAGHLDVVYVPVGLGSGICAHMAVRDLLGVGTEIVGVGADRAPAHALSFDAGHPVSTPEADTFVDGVATRTPVPVAVAAMVAGAARFVRVTEVEPNEPCASCRRRATTCPSPPEHSLWLGAARRHRALPRLHRLVMTGGNCDSDLVRRVIARS